MQILCTANLYLPFEVPNEHLAIGTASGKIFATLAEANCVDDWQLFVCLLRQHPHDCSIYVIQHKLS